MPFPTGLVKGQEYQTALNGSRYKDYMGIRLNELNVLMPRVEDEVA